MAETTIPTLMSLDQYAQIMGIPPVHFYQGVSLAYPDSGGCESVWFQYDWQSPGKASREALARCIAQAETLIAQLTGFWPAPKYIEEESQLYPRQKSMANSEMLSFYPAMITGRRKVVETKWRQFVGGGRRRVSLVASHAEVIYPVDRDHDPALVLCTWPEGSQQNAYELAVFPINTDTSPQFQIRDLTVLVEAGGAVTIAGRPANFLSPGLWEYDEPIDADDTTRYQTHVNVYRIYTCSDDEAYAPVVFEWQVPTSVDMSLAYGTLQAWQPEAGLVAPIPAEWSATSLEWQARVFTPGCEPHKMRLFYLAGWPRDALGRMSQPFARAVAALATSLLVEPICGCAEAEKMAGWWQGYPSREDPVSYRQLDCPWGTRRGAFEAYRLLSTFYGGAGGVSL